MLGCVEPGTQERMLLGAGSTLKQIKAVTKQVEQLNQERWRVRCARERYAVSVRNRMEGGWEKDGSHRPAHRVPPLIGICIRRTHVCRRQRFCFETCGSSAHHATPTRWKCSRCWASLTAMAASSLPPLLSPGAAPLACAAPLGLARAAPLTRGFAAPLIREPRRSSRHSSGDAMLLPPPSAIPKHWSCPWRSQNSVEVGFNLLFLLASFIVLT